MQQMLLVGVHVQALAVSALNTSRKRGGGNAAATCDLWAAGHMHPSAARPCPPPQRGAPQGPPTVLMPQKLTKRMPTPFSTASETVLHVLR